MRKLTHDEISAKRLSRNRLEEAVRAPVIGMLDSVRSLYNVGSMFRTSDAAFIRELFLCGFTPAPPRREIEKTALGATETVPWRHFHDPVDALAVARSGGAKICVLELTDHSVASDAIGPGDFPLCLVVGNEITGVSPSVIASADLAIEIPMFGTKQSLNAAVAYGIALFDLVRIWKNRPPTS